MAVTQIDFTQHPRRHVGICDINGRTATIDASTYVLNTIEYEHHEIHAGSHYYVADFETINEIMDTRIPG